MKNVVQDLKKEILQAAYRSKEGHIASAFSILDILWVLYSSVLNIHPGNINDPDRDIFILSKGHASLGLYAVLAERGFFGKEMLEGFGGHSSILGGHPDKNKVPGVEASTGSLGHGFPIAVGMALGLKMRGSTNRVFALIGDGEANEGTIWESALIAAHHKLHNLVCIIDHNHSTDRAIDMGDIASKFQSFGWRSIVINGHSHEEILEACKGVNGITPTAIIANTIKGRGCAEMENNPAWHHKSPTAEELNSMMSSVV